MAKNNSYPEFKPSEIEPKWQEKWESGNLFSPDVKNAKNPYFNLMMFPYPSAEGLHVGNMYAFTGADVYAKFNRMQGKDVLEPIGLDGFGIHSENYALKVGHHPKEQAEVSEKNFYRQLRSIGNSFDWNRTVETYNPNYYKWTQWLFVQMFKNGLAYRDTALVNWCPKDLTVLSDEQVIDGSCERCGEKVEKKNLEQWFFRITDYAQRLLDNIDGLQWTEKVKIAQRNWIGKSEGAEIDFEVESDSNYLLLHGFTGSVKNDFFPWLVSELEKRGSKVWAQDMPNSQDPSVEEQVNFVLNNAPIDEKTVILGHSLGSVVALKILEKRDRPVRKVVLAAGFAQPGFLDHKRPFEDKFDWKFDFGAIKRNCEEVVYLRAKNDSAVPKERAEFIKEQIGARIVDFRASDDHVTGDEEPEVLKNLLTTLRVFTTRPDTLFGATFMVIAPEHQLAVKIANGAFPNIDGQAVKEYLKLVKSKSEIERTGEGKEKSGVVTGLHAINPVNAEKLPILVCDYVLGGYGTGAIMAVPAHDQRDYDTAKAFNLSIRPVIRAKSDKSSDKTSDLAYVGSGVLMGSNDWDGWIVPADIPKVIEWLEKNKMGTRKDNFHLRDWLISRQRYWGPPIPMIFCSTCEKNGKAEVEGMSGWFTVPEADLPVLLPDVADWKPMGTGKSPLANHPEFYKTTCPNCGNEAERETDVSDTFLDSAWYFLRYPSTDIDVEPFDIETTKKWLPVHQYIGGAEHSVLHLLYSRFVTMVLYDLKFIDFDEPFTNFFAHGLIIKDGAKMSKSKGNVVVPDEYIGKYGADTLRSYLMFIGPYSDGGDFRDSGIEGMYKFLRKVWKLLSNYEETPSNISAGRAQMMMKTIKKVTEDISTFSYNTAIASLMEWYNYLNADLRDEKSELNMQERGVFLHLLAPFAPHMTEELWQAGDTRDDKSEFKSIHLSKWPEYDEKYLVLDTVIIPVQINGKRRGEIEISSSKIDDQIDVERLAKDSVSKHLVENEVKKIIYIPGKIINLVI